MLGLCNLLSVYDNSLISHYNLIDSTSTSDPAMFTTNVATVLLEQRKTFLEDDVSLNHLCFMGCSREEEDQLLNMVVAHFLHRKTQVGCRLKLVI